MKNFTRMLLMLVLSSAIFTSQLSAQNILCVDNDLSGGGFTDCWPMFQAALDANGLTYTYMEADTVTYNGPDAAVMEEYDIVIWFTGEVWSGSQTLTIDDEFNLLLYLTISGGKLFLSAQDYLWDRYEAYGTFSPGEFPYEALGVVTVDQDTYHIEDDPDTARFNGAPGSIAEGLSFPVFDIFTTALTEDGLYADSIAEHMGTSLFTVVQPYISTGTPGLTFEGPNFRSLFTTLSFAAITDIEARDEFMGRIINWLQFGGGVGTNELSTETPDMLISPNPAKDYVNIGMINKMKEVRIINSQGQVVHQQDVNNIKTRVDISQLPTGVYVVQALTVDGQAIQRLIVE